MSPLAGRWMAEANPESPLRSGGQVLSVADAAAAAKKKGWKHVMDCIRSGQPF